MLRLLVDENFPGLAVEELRLRGHDVLWIRTVDPGSSDSAVLAYAKNENRILLTFDKDFGELVFRAGLSAFSGILLFRIPPHSPQHVAETVVAVLESRDDWAGHFSVVEETRIRMRKLPD